MVRRLLVAAIGSVGALLLALAPSAHAWGDATYENDRTGECITDTAKGYVMMPCQPTSTIDWSQHFAVSGYDSVTTWWRLQNRGTGRCIDVSSKGLRSWPCQRADSPYTHYQSWRTSGMVPGIPLLFRLQNRWSGACLLADVHALRMGPCKTYGQAGWQNQTWTVRAR
jgi:hypothetical protein